ncbi:3-deoxy-7-phosphoheptulonate synthase [Streptomyces lavendulae]|uniref:3-deoxy-7-phosphoheptulonate synthase n=1 Tax=Streptomyces lavendulae TaxID=1914 RepID=UPI0031E55CE3
MSTSASNPYPLVGLRDNERATVMVKDVTIGCGPPVLIAGPCAVETETQMFQAAEMARAAGARLLRGGAFKPRTSPYSFQGLALNGLRLLHQASVGTALPLVTEVVDTRDVETVAQYADMLQIGARNMHNFALLRAVGATRMPVLLKRGVAATIDEWLYAAEYIAQAGGEAIVLCERGIRTFETRTRFTLDVAAVPVLRQLTKLPVMVDPSHAAGERRLVLPLARASLAAGADGLLVELHPDPAKAACDGPQALIGTDIPKLAALMRADHGIRE